LSQSREKSEELIVAAYHGDLVALRLALDSGADVNFKDLSGYTALHWVSFMGVVGEDRAEMARVLIDAGADVNSSLSDEGPSVLSTACDAGNPEIVRLLVEHGADVNDDRDGSTPLIQSIHSANIEIVQYLLLHGADPKKRDLSGKSPVEVAIETERFEIAELLSAQ
jgi:ankyrin repeat protein